MKNFGLLFMFMLMCFYSNAQSSTHQKNLNQTEVSSVAKIKVFPNPATNVVNILGLENSSKALIIISDVYGNVVLQHQWQIQNKALSIPIPNLEAGIYVVRIESEAQHIQTKFYKK